MESPRSSVIFVLNLLCIVEGKPAHAATLFTGKIKEEEEGGVEVGGGEPK